MATTANSTNLFKLSTPSKFWRLIGEGLPRESDWQTAMKAAAKAVSLPLSDVSNGKASLMDEILGEGQFGDRHWRLSRAKRLYYECKPVLPRTLTRTMRRLYNSRMTKSFILNWPTEDRYVRFQRETVRQLLQLTGRSAFQFIHFWPHGRRTALVLTHDIETAMGQENVRHVMDLEESLGFRSSFNFVPERYPLDLDLIQELESRGFEVGIHGLKHDGKLFFTKAQFDRRSAQINAYLGSLGAVGFRAPFTHRHPQWLQELDIEYDMSFFDTDPYEPIPGGTMSIWPFLMGKFVELPYTLVQDHTLVYLLGEKTARVWRDKARFIRKNFGMMLLNAHPDYLLKSEAWDIYSEFLRFVAEIDDVWHALPREVAAWWRLRNSASHFDALPRATLGEVRLTSGGVIIETPIDVNAK